MHVDNTRLKKLLHNLLKPHGFSKKSNTWYTANEDVISVINLQKSSFSNLYYVNLAAYFKALGGEEFPKEYQCHLRTRLNNDLVDYPVDYSYLFDLEQAHEDNDKYAQHLALCAEKVMLPQVDLLKTKEGYMRILEKTPALVNIVPFSMRAYWNI